MIYSSQIGNYGHLGNQMFQYASLRGIASNRGFDWAIPSAGEFGNRYPLRSSIYACFELDSLTDHNIIRTIASQTVVERKFDFDEELFDSCPDNSDLIGYFQSYRYFDQIKDSIRQDFKFKPDVADSAKKFLKDIDTSNAVSVHVRRTDYVSNSAYHTNIPADFYLNVIKNIGNIDHVVIFSDDIGWCRENFRGSDVLFSDQSAYIDMCAMSMCRTNIIANSSFSWWAAWLNQWKNKLVFSPSQWFGPANAHLNTKDLIPKDWIKL